MFSFKQRFGGYNFMLKKPNQTTYLNTLFDFVSQYIFLLSAYFS